MTLSFIRLSLKFLVHFAVVMCVGCTAASRDTSNIKDIHNPSIFLEQKDLTTNFVGDWSYEKDPGATLSIKDIGNQTLKLTFSGTRGAWDGIAYPDEFQALGLFRYNWHRDPVHAKDKGYITFKLLANGKLLYRSFDSNGHRRSSGYYFRFHKD